MPTPRALLALAAEGAHPESRLMHASRRRKQPVCKGSSCWGTGGTVGVLFWSVEYGALEVTKEQSKTRQAAGWRSNTKASHQMKQPCGLQGKGYLLCLPRG